MTSRFIFGQYKPSDSFGHRLDPRGKILFAVFLMAIAIFTTSISFYAAMIICLVLLMRLSAIRYGMMLKNLGPFLILISITALYHLIFSARESAEIIDIYGFRLTEGGVYMAATFSLRVILFVAIAFFISLTTMPSDMGEALVSFFKPLNRWKIPVNDIGLIIFIAMRFIPVLAEEFETIRKAQTIRGVNFSGGIVSRSRKMVYLLIPVFQSAIRRADDLAIAIESRGYISGAERSSYREFRFIGRDWIFMAISFAVVLLLFAVSRWY